VGVVAIADDRWLQWQAEYARTNRLPPIGLVLFVFTVTTVLLISLLGGYDRMAEGTNRGKPPTLCQEHQGAPGWDYACGRPYTPPPPGH
jgi:hypothetical protein